MVAIIDQNADLNRDGIVDSDDENLIGTDDYHAMPAGHISAPYASSGTGNIVGYAGYLFNAEIHGSGMYTVRHRHYSPELGRWLSRDPIGYVDGMSLYEYVRSGPLSLLDAYGLSSGWERTGRTWTYRSSRTVTCCCGDPAISRSLTVNLGVSWILTVGMSDTVTVTCDLSGKKGDDCMTVGAEVTITQWRRAVFEVLRIIRRDGEDKVFYYYEYGYTSDARPVVYKEAECEECE